MKTKKIIYAIGLALLISSCAKTEESAPEQGYIAGKMIFHAYNADEAETKTSLQSDGSIYWSATEDINLFYGSTASAKFTSSNTSEAASVDFTGDLGDITVNADTSFWAVYPYSESNTCDGESITVTLPSSQTAVAGTFAEDLFISVAKSQSTDLYFYNVCGGVKFQVPTSGIKSVTFKGTNGEVLAGTAKVMMDSEGKPYIAEITDPQTELTLTPADGGTFSKGKDYYFVAFPTTLKGFEIRYNKSSVSAPYVQEMDVEIKRSTWGTITKSAVSNVFNNYITITCRELGEYEEEEYYDFPVIKIYLDKDHNAYELDTLQTIGANKIYGVPYGFACNTYDSNIISFDFSNWDASLVTDASYMFYGCANLTSVPDLSCLTNVSKVCHMFTDCASWVSDVDLSTFSSLEDASYMFEGSGITTPPDISALTSVTNASHMFDACVSMTTPPDLSSLSKVTNASHMFDGCGMTTPYGCGMTTPPDLSNLKSLENAEYMFAYCYKLETGPDMTGLTSLVNAECMYRACFAMKTPPRMSGLSSLRNAEEMFVHCSSMETGPDLSGLTSLNNAKEMFYGCTSMKTPPIMSGLSSLQEVYQMFYKCTNMETGPDITGLTSLESSEGMFANCTAMKTPPKMSGMTSLTRAYKMFLNCTSLETGPDLSGLTSLSNTQYMFKGCTALKKVPDLSVLIALSDASYMFQGSGLEETPNMKVLYDLYASTEQRIHIEGLFSKCDSLIIANLGYFNINAFYAGNLFDDCTSLKKVTTTYNDEYCLDGLQYLLERTGKTVTQTGPDENGVITFTLTDSSDD